MVPLPEGEQLILDLPEPGLLSNLDPNLIGVAVTDGYGRIKRTWGLASRLELLSAGSTLLETPLANLVEAAAQRGEGGCLFLDGYRFYSASSRAGRTRDVLLLVTDAQEELKIRASSTQNARSAELFRRIGKALAMHQTLDELSVLAVHEIASACGLAAVLLWGKGTDEDKLNLKAHVGVNRQGARLLETLEPESKVSCTAELVAMKRQPFWTSNVSEGLLTNQLEAKFCYLKPKGMGCLPLTIGDKVIGILEVVGREEDTRFLEAKELFETLAEHLALALNTALMFESVERMASFDPMTGIANHRALQEFMTSRVSESERTGTQLGVLMIDVDHFRAFNEEEGHDAGDFVLKEVAKKIKDTLRPYDLPARYGGEEFSAVLPGLDLHYSTEVAERLRRAIESIEYLSPNGRSRHVTASIGVASYPETARDCQSLLKAADVALFKAKRAGRNRVVYYEGQFKEEPKVTDLEDTSWLEDWLREDERKISDALWEYLRPYAKHVSEQLALSKNQQQILENLIKVYPGYRRMMAENDPELMRSLELAAEFRPLLPSLMTMNERFDGTGPMQMKAQKIPLLARVLSALITLAEDQGEPLVRDPARFDPEIVTMITEVSEAA